MANKIRFVLIILGSISISSASIINVSADSATIQAAHDGAVGTLTGREDSAAKEKKIHFTLRLGQGGFSDDRSPIGKLGGGQLTLDIKPINYPIAISITNEYYTNCPDPTHSYEISSLVAINLLYITKLFKSGKTDIFLGGGIGQLEVPKGENEPDAMVNGIVYNFEGGFNIKLIGPIGFYGIGKYLYAQKKADSIKVIDFSERIVLLGFTFNFSL